jgi:hypothetical protein
MPPANHTRHFRAAPNNIRVVTNVDHNVHMTYDPKRIAIMHYADSVRHVGKQYRLP